MHDFQSPPLKKKKWGGDGTDNKMILFLISFSPLSLGNTHPNFKLVVIIGIIWHRIVWLVTKIQFGLKLVK